MDIIENKENNSVKRAGASQALAQVLNNCKLKGIAALGEEYFD